ncbi:uncharacterized protein DI49_0024 [Saccharomyces eubayanus]|uniref:uncharacterized protein n=1 Tax=Saccharomyces eubayanus TaxID=1080349 RepID=UPI0006C1C57C|nr:hypothetical protein DI49_0024 [Saccharomyces eubayanus]KOH01357.1 hypothetical protein DI49_0024 [Saccharomyces eubayanus]
MTVEEESPETDDLRLQQLDNNIFFGSCEVLAQPILLQYENIKFIIGVNLTTEKIASFYTVYFQHSNSLIVNFDSSSTQETIETPVELYNRNNTILLQKFVSQYLQMGKTNTPLSLTRFGKIQSLPQFCNSNVLTGEPLVQYQAFNDLLTLFKSFKHLGNILVVSSHSHDPTLIKFLVSRVIACHPSVTIQESLQYTRAILNLPINACDEFDILNDKGLQELAQAPEILQQRSKCSSKRRCGNPPENYFVDNKSLTGPSEHIKRGHF